MKVIFVALLVASFVGVAVFSVFGMGHENDHARGCIAVIASQADCPNISRLLDSITFHFNAFQSFSLATFNENILSGLLSLLFSLLLAGLYIFGSSRLEAPRGNLSPGRQFREDFSYSPKQQLAHWLALHENSPSFSRALI